MDYYERGMFIRILDPVNESLRGRKITLIVDLLITILMPIVVFIIFSGIDLSVWFKIYFPILLVFMGIASDLTVQYMFSKSMGAISLYSNGFEPPKAWIHKLTGRRPFITKEKIAIMQSSATWQKLEGGPYLVLSYKDHKGMITFFGVRRKEDVEATLDYVKKEWKMPIDASFDISSMNRRVERGSPGETSPPIAHKIPVSNAGSNPPPQQPVLFCPNCGARDVPYSEFCPMCGHRAGQPVVRYIPPQPIVAPQPPVQGPPPIVQEVSPLPSYLQKSARLAFLLAFVPGFFCIIGLGHFYTKRIVKGIILLFVGFFVGTFAWVSLSMVFTESRFETIAYVITAMVFWAIFMAILLWSAFDASKQAKKYNALPPAKVSRINIRI